MPETLEVLSTENKPYVLLDAEQNLFRISGYSLPSNGKDFYDPIISWMESYSQQPNPSTVFQFDLEEFNIYSAKMILFILYSLKKIADSGKNVSVRWYYDQEGDEMFESGKDYEIMVKVPFEFVIGNVERS